MATLTTGARDAACDAIVNLIDVGSADANGDLQFQTAGSVVVATLQFSAPAFGNSATGVATAAAIASDTNATGNASAITQAVFRNRDNAAVLTATVQQGAGSDFNMSSTTIGAGDTVSVTNLTVTMPES